ncbi:hypothetical protein [Paenibacillus sp. LjRoot56]
MKVRLTSYGKPFGRPMHREVAMLYIEQTKHVFTGIHFEVITVR